MEILALLPDSWVISLDIGSQRVKEFRSVNVEKHLINFLDIIASIDSDLSTSWLVISFSCRSD